MDRFFPTSKFIKRRVEITGFEQRDGENLHEAYERFKVILKRCPDHGYDDFSQMQIFCHGLRPNTKMMLDASAGGSMNNKTAKEARELVEAMASNEYLVHNDRGAQTKRGIFELETT